MWPIERSVLPPTLRALRDRIRHGEDLIALLVKQQVIVTEVWATHMPVKVLRLHIEREDIRQHAVQCGGNIAYSIFTKCRRGA
jgi:hypothetical protein